MSGKKTTIVTGAQQGIGAGLVEGFLKEGYNVVATSLQASQSLAASPYLVLVDGDIGRVGAELDMEAGRKAAHLAALNVLAVVRKHLGSLDKVTRIVRRGVSVATSGDAREQPKVADAASELLQDVFGKDKNPCRLVYGAASLPLGTPVELEVIFQVGS